MDAYAAMLPVLLAEDSLRAADVAAYPHLSKQSDRRGLRQRWQRAAQRTGARLQELTSAADVRAWFARAGYAI